MAEAKEVEVKVGSEWFLVAPGGTWVKALRFSRRHGRKHWAMIWNDYRCKAPGPVARAAFDAAGIQPKWIKYDDFSGRPEWVSE